MNISNKTLLIYNSLTEKKELFRPVNNNGYIGIYVCGPTVYNHLHLGNYRTFIIFDVIFRYLMHLGYKVRYVRNITDVGHLENEENDEDKIVKRSLIEGLDPMEIVQKYTVSFHNTLNILNILPPSIEPTATGHIIEQIELIKTLIYKELAYEANGSVYFNLNNYVKKYRYGIISKNKIENLIFNKNFSYNEKNYLYDFSIWKKSNKKKIMSWISPWGNGVPGWHTECVSMSTKYLGNIFDIHGGGIDLKFPHHECELAQSIGINNTEKTFARYWIHTNMLTINGKKMSKSLKNFLRIEYLINKKIISSPNVFKLFILQFHYRSIINFSIENLKKTEKSYIKIKRSIEILEKFVPNNTNKINIKFDVHNWINKCYESINDDFNTPMLISYLFKASNFIINSELFNNITIFHFNLLKKHMNHFIFDILGFSKINCNINNDKKFNSLVNNLIKFRNKIRKQKNWIISDKIREILLQFGIITNDKKL
ncbi:cysteine--tRNA ligase [Blattabacterium cuenoti]|uniref:cysteine--tRNA ligase n=1 Tax=Blattabacterium cuenoti TaxID=1653831 RepID=UPI00163B9CF2|nr:cysteine--tRNA ligase [Blattabacterium cuenoti]